MNKKINKAGFKSFFKHKLAVILLGIVVLFSAATFTILDSTRSNFSASYNKAVDEGHLHQYTAKEIYDVQNKKIAFKTEADPTTVRPVKKLDFHDSPFTFSDGNKNWMIMHTTGRKSKGGFLDRSPLSTIEPYGIYNLEARRQLDKTYNYNMTTIAIDTSQFTFTVDSNGKITDLTSKKDLIHMKRWGDNMNPSITFGFDDLSPGNAFSGVNYADLYKAMLKLDSKKSGAMDFTYDIPTSTAHGFPQFDPTSSWDDSTVSVEKRVKDWIIKNINDYISDGFAKNLSIIDSQEATYVTKIDTDPTKTSNDFIGLASSQNYQFRFSDLYFGTSSSPDLAKNSLVIQGNTENQNFIIIHKAHAFSTIKNRLSEDFQTWIKKSYGNKLDFAKIESSSANAGGKYMKVVSNDSPNVDNLLIYDGEKYSSSDPLKLKQKAVAEFAKLQNSGYGSHPHYDASSSWKVEVRFNHGMVPKSFIVADPSSFEGVVSPTYANKNNIKPIENIAIFRGELEKATLKLSFPNDKAYANYPSINDLKKKYSKSLISLGNTVFFATGIGLSPDFSYPIISSKKVIVDPKNDVVIWANPAGLSRFQEDFASSQQEENYLGLRFKDGVSESDRESIVQAIESEARKRMAWPQNVRIISKYNDTSEKVIMAPARISFLEKINSSVGKIMAILITSLLLLTALIVVISQRKIINSQKKTIAIINANGYSRRMIAGSFILPSLIVTAGASLTGYLLGLAFQPLVANIFSSLWTLPLENAHFSWISLLLVVLIPMALIPLLVFLISLFETRGNVLNNISGGKRNFASGISASILSKISWFGIKTKLSMSILINNIGKTFVIILVSAVSIAAMSTTFVMAGKFNYAVENTQHVNNYEFAIDLASPTKEGGQYIPTVFEDPKSQVNINKWNGRPTRYWSGMYKDAQDTTGILDPNKLGYSTARMNGIPADFYGVHNKTGGAIQTAPGSYMKTFTHVPAGWDGIIASGAKAMVYWKQTGRLPEASFYLRNRVQNKVLLNAAMGNGIVSVYPGDPEQTIPWEINKMLMPLNQRVAAEESYYDFLDSMINIPLVKNMFDTQTKINNFDNPTRQVELSENWYNQVVKIVKKRKSGSSISSLHEDEKRLAYAIVIFTVSGELILRPSFLKAYELALRAGIHPIQIAYNQVSLNLDDETYTSIRGESRFQDINGNYHTDKLSVKGIYEGSKFLNVGSSMDKVKKYKDNNIPVLVNRYMKKYYELKEGDVFSSTVTNSYDRYAAAGVGHPPITKKVNYEVVGFIDSYQGDEVVTLKSRANAVLGLDPIQGFNGVFSKHKSPEVLKNTNLYSNSGYYPAWATFDPNDPQDDTTDLLTKALTANYNPEVHEANVHDFAAKFTHSMYVSTIADVDWSNINRYTFKTMNNLSSKIIIFAESIALFIAAILIAIIGSFAISSNRRNIAMMKTLGYSNKEIRNVFLKSFLPPILIGALIAIPMVFAVLATISIVIMSFAAIYIPIAMLGWEILAAAVVIGIVFMGMFMFSINSMKSHSALEAFKE